MLSCSFFFNDTATTEIYTLSLHDALPIWSTRTWSPCASDPTCAWPPSVHRHISPAADALGARTIWRATSASTCASRRRSEEHTSELQSRQYLVCRLLLEKKTTIKSFCPIR